MTVAAVVLLAATAVIGALAWFAVDRHRHEHSAPVAALAAAPALLMLAAAAVLALAADPPGTGLLATATAFAVAAAVPGGALVATAFLRVADRAHPTRERSPRLTPNAPPATADPVSVVPPPPPPPPASVDATTSAPSPAFSDPETLRGGAAIGMLERVAVVVTLLARWPEGLALILAVKGFGRYPELRKPSAPERFIIGTFASILWAVAVAGVVIAPRT